MSALLSAREAFREAYRRDRTTYRLVSAFRVKTGNYPDMLHSGLSPGFDICRLHGDRLSTFYPGVTVSKHRARMCELRLRPRLPA
ncbi:hypothetical protein [Pseudoxanthomonas mexicana]|uniref:hypothetical protein n=1 Tax=Pseudoxanthomonas mexicana TaxID=128785 RepID=UPI00398A5530